MKFLRILTLAGIVLLPGTGLQVYGQQEKRDEKHAKPEKQQAQPQQHQQQQPKQQAQPKERAQAQPRQQSQPKEKAQAQPRQESQPKEKAQAQPKQQAQPKEKAQSQPRQQQQRAQHQQPAQQGNPSGQRSSYAPPQRTRQQAQTWQQQGGWRQQGGWQGQATFQQDRSSNWGSEHRDWGQRGGYGGYYIPLASFDLHFGTGHWFRIHSQPYIVAGYPRFQYGGFTFMMVDPWPGDWSQDWYASDDVYVGYDNGYYLYDRMHPGEAVAISVVL
jgi:hypothetical protein